MTAAAECQLIENLQAGVGIVHKVADTPSELRRQFARGERQQSVARLMEGEDQGNAGQTYGLLDLAQRYQRALTEHPKPPAEFVPWCRSPNPRRTSGAESPKVDSGETRSGLTNQDSETPAIA